MSAKCPRVLGKIHTPVPAIPMEEVARYPRPGTAVPAAFAFSSDDRLIGYLFSPEATLTLQLFAFDPKSGEHRPLVAPPDRGTSEENVSHEEALRRERQRQIETGVTHYAWAEHTNRLLIPLQGSICVQDDPDAPLRTIVERGEKPILDAQFSPDGNWVAYVQDAELYVVPTAGGEPCQITNGARGTGKTNGLAEYVAQEEVDRSHGFWWSPDSASIAFVEVDETHIPVYRITHQGKDAVGQDAQEDHRFPFAGEANARVSRARYSVIGGRCARLDGSGRQSGHLPRSGPVAARWRSQRATGESRADGARTRPLRPKHGPSPHYRARDD